MWPTDILALAASAMDYCGSNGKPLPSDVVVLWHVEHHPCDSQPWLSGVSFEPSAALLGPEEGGQKTL